MTVNLDHEVHTIRLLSCFACNIAAASTTAFQPTVLKTLGFTASQAQIHTIPVYMVAMFACLTTGYLSDRFRTRYPFVLLGGLICLFGWAIEFLAVKHINSTTGLGWPGQRYAGMFLIAMGESVQLPILVVWVSNCLRGRKERVVGFATLIGGSQVGNLVSASVFLTRQEKCGYRTGFATGVGVGCLGILAATAFFAGLWWENRGLERREIGGSEELNGEGRKFRNTL
jgi:dipeptide/tripeptide permease